jgi:tetratricopeptide (TPR) repeat protein
VKPILLTVLLSWGASAQSVWRDESMRLVLTQAPRNLAIDTAQKQVDAGDFEEAVRTIEEGIGDPELSDEQLAEMYRLLGLASLSLGNEARARQAYEKLLQAQPDYELPRSVSPRIVAIYARIKEDIKKRRVRPVTLTVAAPADVRAGQPLAVDAIIEDLSLGAKARLFYRRGGAQSFSFTTFTKVKGKQNAFTAVVPAFELPIENTAYDLEYFVEVADAAQRRLAGRGDPFNALRVQIPPPQTSAGASGAPLPVTQRAWFWVVVGVAVAAAAATTVAVVASQPRTGTVPVTIQFQEEP